MPLPSGAKVVVIDDQYDEIKNLLRAFAKNMISYCYFNGKKESLPEGPLAGVRFVFLDINLHGAGGQGDKNKASISTAILREIIDKNNGPYVIIFWTQHEYSIDDVLTNCIKLNISPIYHIKMEKAKYINPSCDIDELSKEIKEALNGIPAFQLYSEWENIIHSATGKLINDFSNFVSNETDWNQATQNLFYHLYKTYVDKNLIRDSNEQFKCACHVMNTVFFDTLQKLTTRDLKIPENFRLNNTTPLSELNKAKLNTALLTSNILTNTPKTGYVFKAENSEIKKAIIKMFSKSKIFKEDYSFKSEETEKAYSRINLCNVIISAECDSAQDKLLKTDNKKYHRFVYGIYCSKHDFDTYAKNKNLGDVFFTIGAIDIDGEMKFFCFCFHTISIAEEEYFDRNNNLLSFRREIMFDLISKASNHVNRLGNIQFQ